MGNAQEKRAHEGSEERVFNKEEFMKNFKEFETIEGVVRSYKTGEVAEMLYISPGMTRYYCREFSDFIGIESNSGEHRTFNHKQIINLKYIVYLIKVKNLSVQQVKEYLATPQGRLFAPMQSDEERISSYISAVSNQIRSEIGNIIRSEVSSVLSSAKEEIKLSLFSSLQEQAKSIEEISIAIENKVSKTVEENSNQIQKLSEQINDMKINEVHEKVKDVDSFISEWRLKQEQSVREKAQERKGLLARLFK